MVPDNLYTTLILPFSAFIALLLLCMSIVRIFGRMSRKKELIARIRGGGTAAVSAHNLFSEPDNSSLLKNGIANTLKKLGLRVATEKSADYTKMKARFVKAGMRSSSAVSAFYGMKAMLTFFPVLAFLMLRFTVLNSSTVMLPWRSLCSLP